MARFNGNQIIAASHSEVLLNEAADRDVVVAFVGKPHRINDRGSQLLKSLREIGWEDYYLAQQTGWVLYLEGSTDFAILKAFARTLGDKEAQEALERPFVHYVSNLPDQVRRHFHGLKEAVPSLRGVALFDRLDRELPDDLGAQGLVWRRYEIENYLCYPETLEAYARANAETDTEGPGPLFSFAEVDRRMQAMKESIEEVSHALQTLGKPSPWDSDLKVSGDFFDPLFNTYFQRLGLPNVMAKKNYHELADLVPRDKLDKEILKKLNSIVRVAKSARQIAPE